MPEDFSTYFEPFLGGGAVLFELQPRKAVVSDISKELINIYLVIKNSIEELIEDLRKHRNDKGYFYEVRRRDRDREHYNRLPAVQRASRMLFLNKTCFNGLFRVNKSGEFNVPFGNYKKPNIVNEKTLRAVSNYFNESTITIACWDFERALEGAEKGDFVYLDPPYDPLSGSSNFTNYCEKGFDRSEQLRLKKACDSLHKKGVSFLLSNSATDFIKDLYRHYRIEVIQAKRAINSKASGRGAVDEVLVMNYK